MDLDKIILFGELQGAIMKNELLIQQIEAKKPNKTWQNNCQNLKDCNFIIQNAMKMIENQSIFLSDLSHLKTIIGNETPKQVLEEFQELKRAEKDIIQLNKEIAQLKKNIGN